MDIASFVNLMGQVSVNQQAITVQGEPPCWLVWGPGAWRTWRDIHLPPNRNRPFALPDIFDVLRPTILGHDVGDEDAPVAIRGPGIAVEPATYSPLLITEVDPTVLHGDVEAKSDPHFCL